MKPGRDRKKAHCASLRHDRTCGSRVGRCLEWRWIVGCGMNRPLRARIAGSGVGSGGYPVRHIAPPRSRERSAPRRAAARYRDSHCQSQIEPTENGCAMLSLSRQRPVRIFGREDAIQWSQWHRLEPVAPVALGATLATSHGKGCNRTAGFLSPTRREFAGYG